MPGPDLSSLIHHLIILRMTLQGTYIMISISQMRKLGLREGKQLPGVVTTPVCRTENSLTLSPCL